MKTCSKCGLAKELDEFHRERLGRDGRRCDCRDCHRGPAKERYIRHREQRLAKQGLYYLQHGEQCRKTNKEWDLAHLARRAWISQKAGSKKRGILFHFSFEQWVKWWGADLDRRGAGADDLVMARFMDDGAYEPSNVYKATRAENSSGPRQLPALLAAA